MLWLLMCQNCVAARYLLDTPLRKHRELTALPETCHPSWLKGPLWKEEVWNSKGRWQMLCSQISSSAPATLLLHSVCVLTYPFVCLYTELFATKYCSCYITGYKNKNSSIFKLCIYYLSAGFSAQSILLPPLLCMHCTSLSATTFILLLQ